MNLKFKLLMDRLLGKVVCWMLFPVVRLVGILARRDHSTTAENVRCVVVAKYFGLGSIIHATPMLRAIKIHAQIDLRGPIPVCIFVSPGSLHDVNWLDALVFEPGAIYLFDKGYIDFRRLYRIAASGAFFVTRAKDNLRFS